MHLRPILPIPAAPAMVPIVLLADACIPVARAAARHGAIPVAFTDPLSGSFANAGESALRHFRSAFDRINARGGASGYRFANVALEPKRQVQQVLAQLHLAADPEFVSQSIVGSRPSRCANS